jgi:hypothetical protein
LLSPPADLAEVTRIYGIRHRIEQSCKQVKDELGWADFQVRSDTAIRRHQALVNCAFSFCWDAWFHDHPAPRQTADPRPAPGRGERGAARRLTTAGTVLAAGAARDTRLAHPLTALQRWWQAWPDRPPPPQLQALMDSVAAGCGLHPLHPELTNYR